MPVNQQPTEEAAKTFWRIATWVWQNFEWITEECHTPKALLWWNLVYFYKYFARVIRAIDGFSFDKQRWGFSFVVVLYGWRCPQRFFYFPFLFWGREWVLCRVFSPLYVMSLIIHTQCFEFRWFNLRLRDERPNQKITPFGSGIGLIPGFATTNSVQIKILARFFVPPCVLLGLLWSCG